MPMYVRPLVGSRPMRRLGGVPSSLYKAYSTGLLVDSRPREKVRWCA